jgi:ATP-dependent Clp protease adaptor protein ClpS
MTLPAAGAETDTDAATSDDAPWVTIVWNDPVNLMSYVTYVT